MNGVNKVTIIGTLGQDPDVKYTASGSAIVTVSVATNEKWKDKTTGESQEHTEWHRVVVFNKLAEICAQWLKKGSQVYFEGKNKTRKWQDAQGNDRYTHEIVAHDMQMLGGKPDGSRPAAPRPQGQQQQRPEANSRPMSSSNQAPAQEAAPIDDGFDDIPF